MGGKYAIDESYRETIPLPGGSAAVLRMVVGEDKPLFQDALARYSDSVIYHRFFVTKKRFTPQELQWLTEFDGWNHFALGLTELRDGKEVGVAVARFVRDRGQDDRAEFAIAIGDPYQGMGIGRVLLGRLALAAWERGIRTFLCDVLAENRRALRFLSTYHPTEVSGGDASVRRLQFDVAQLAASARNTQNTGEEP